MTFYRRELVRVLQKYHLRSCLVQALHTKNVNKLINPDDLLSGTSCTSQKETNLLSSHLRSQSRNLSSNHPLCHSTSRSLSLETKRLEQRSLHTTVSLNKAVPFNLADIGEGIREVTIKEWNPEVRVGARIAEFDLVCEVESDKASVSITSRYSGVVTKVYHKEGDVAHVGNPLIEIEMDGEVNESKSRCDAESDAIGKENRSVNVASDSTETCSAKDDNTKANMEPDDSSQPLEQVKPGESAFQNEQHQGTLNEPVVLNKNRWKILATPAVRRMIKQHNIDTKHLRGTGKQGRVLKEDIVSYMNSPMVNDTQTSKVESGSKSPSVIPIRGYVKGMFKSMTESNTIPTLRFTEEVDTSHLKKIKNELSQLYQEKFDLKVTYMPFFIKALSLCIAEYPILNASIDRTEENIIVNPQHNICIAIDTKHGLVVPNIKGVNNLSLGNIAHELTRLMTIAHEGKVPPSDLQGGTIAMSNVGNVGGSIVQPIVMPRQVSIVAMGRMQVLPRYDASGSLVPRSILNVTWAADHRVVDGATTARAATLWKSLVENPLLLLAS